VDRFAHRNGKRFVVRADEKLTAFLELQAAIILDLRLRWKVVPSPCFAECPNQNRPGDRGELESVLHSSLLPFGFAALFARILRETFTEKQNDAPSRLRKRASVAAEPSRIPAASTTTTMLLLLESP